MCARIFSQLSWLGHVIVLLHLIVSDPKQYSDLYCLISDAQFNINEWISTDVGTSKQGELLTTVCHALAMCGCNTTNRTDGADLLLEVSLFTTDM